MNLLIKTFFFNFSFLLSPFLFAQNTSYVQLKFISDTYEKMYIIIDSTRYNKKPEIEVGLKDVPLGDHKVLIFMENKSKPAEYTLNIAKGKRYDYRVVKKENSEFSKDLRNLENSVSKELSKAFPNKIKPTKIEANEEWYELDLICVSDLPLDAKIPVSKDKNDNPALNYPMKK